MVERSNPIDQTAYNNREEKTQILMYKKTRHFECHTLFDGSKFEQVYWLLEDN